MTERVSPQIWLAVNLANLFYWIGVVDEYQGSGLIKKDDLPADTAIHQAMEFTGVNSLNLSLIGKVHSIVDDWLNKDDPLKPLDEYAMADILLEELADGQTVQDSWNLVNLYFRTEQSGVDKKGFGMPLIIAAFGNALDLNEALEKIKGARLDTNIEFKECFKTALAIRAVANETNDEMGFAQMKPTLDRIFSLLRFEIPKPINTPKPEPLNPPI